MMAAFPTLIEVLVTPVVLSSCALVGFACLPQIGRDDGSGGAQGGDG